MELDARDIDQDIDGIGWGASLEFGKRFPIGVNTAITTRSRVVYTDVDFDSFTDDDGVEVRQDDSASIVIGPAVTIETLFPDNGIALYADVSVSRELLDESSIDASGFTFESGLEDTWGTIAIGLEADLANGTSAFIQADISSPFGSTFGDSLGYGLTAGVRIDF